MRKALIAPSILSADFTRLASEIEEVESAGCDVIHVDVMDGHFVPNLTIGPVVVEWIRKVTKLPLDVHLMIEEPNRYIERFRDAGSDWITVHVEACQDLAGTLKAIKASGAKAGVSLRPKTEIDLLKPYLSQVDLILVMTVEPGFGGQSFMPDMMSKVSELRPMFEGLISVDGGINADTIKAPWDAGADVFVAGNSIFGSKDRRRQINALRHATT